MHAVELQFVRAFAENTPVEESVELAQEAIAELEPLGDELALARAWWLRSSGDIAACRWRARAEGIERALDHARRARAGVEMVGTLAGLLGQALLHGPTPVDEAVARIESLPEELGLDAPLRGSLHTSLAGLLALRGDIEGARRLFRDAAATYEEFGMRFRRATQSFVGAQIELLAGDGAAAERELRASSAAFDEIGAATSAPTHRALLAEVVARLGRLEEAEELAQRVAGGGIVRRPHRPRPVAICARPRSRPRRLGPGGGRAGERGAPAAGRCRVPPACDRRAHRSRRSSCRRGRRAPEAERLLAEARTIAEAKGAVASRRAA